MKFVRDLLSLALKFQQGVEFVGEVVEFREVFDALFEGALFLKQYGGLLLVVPEVRGRREFFDLLQPFFPGSGVKDTP